MYKITRIKNVQITGIRNAQDHNEQWHKRYDKITGLRMHKNKSTGIHKITRIKNVKV